MPVRYVRNILCRHTQTDHNAQHRYSGARENIPLNQEGWLQAEILAKKVAILPVHAIYCSDLLRARQVASIIALHLGLEVTVDQRLRETDIGAIGTLTKEEARQLYPADHFRTSNLHYDFRSIGGESREQVIARQMECLQEICAAHGHEQPPGPLIVIVGHGTAFRDILAHCNDTSELHKQGDYQYLNFSY